jgi:hypothetical protein
VIGAERGAVVARAPRAGMLPVWALAVRGAVVSIGAAGERIAVELVGGELYLVDPGSGAAVAAAGWAARWRPVTGSDLLLVEPPAPTGAAWEVLAYGADGAPRFAAALPLASPWLPGTRGRHPAAPLALAHGPAARRVAVIDPASGEVTARLLLPPRAVPGAVFATVVDGRPVAGALLAEPLGALLF